MKTFIKVACAFVVVFVFAAAQASANILAWDVSGHGSPVDTTLVASTIQAGIANSPSLSRVDVIGTATGNAFAQNNWNNTASFLQNNNYVTFTLTADSGGISLESLSFAQNGSATEPRSGRWGYSVNGGAFTTFDFISSVTVVAQTWDFVDVPLSGGDNVEFRWWQFGTAGNNGGVSSTGGTGRLPGNGNILSTNNELILTYSVIPEPSTMTLIGFGLVGLLALARRRHA